MTSPINYVDPTGHDSERVMQGAGGGWGGSGAGLGLGALIVEAADDVASFVSNTATNLDMLTNAMYATGYVNALTIGFTNGSEMVNNVLSASDKVAETVSSISNATGGGSHLPPENPNEIIRRLERSIRTLGKRIDEHTQKLIDYINVPYAYDNKGMFGNASSEQVVQNIINGCINHLQNEITNFTNLIKEAKDAIELIKNIK